MTHEKILLVDDDADVLAGYQLTLRKLFRVETALGGAAGLDAVSRQGPYAVIVSDVRMPGMNGIEFLSRTREAAPDSVRMILTGYADVDAAMGAVNEGAVFRFLTKPCPPEALSRALMSGLDQYRLITAEHELLEQTLKGAVKVLTDTLSLVSPAAFGRASRARLLINQLSARMKPPKPWQWEIAAMLSQTGCVTLPPELLDKAVSGKMLTTNEYRMFMTHPQVGAGLIANIPRLAEVADIVAYQEKHYDGGGSPCDDRQGDQIPLGARALHASLACDTLRASGMEAKRALSEMRQRKGHYDPSVLEALDALIQTAPKPSIRMVMLSDLKPGMILEKDIHAVNGILLIGKGQEITSSMKQRLINISESYEILQPIHVSVIAQER